MITFIWLRQSGHAFWTTIRKKKLTSISCLSQPKYSSTVVTTSKANSISFSNLKDLKSK